MRQDIAISYRKNGRKEISIKISKVIDIHVDSY